MVCSLDRVLSTDHVQYHTTDAVLRDKGPVQEVSQRPTVTVVNISGNSSSRSRSSDYKAVERNQCTGHTVRSTGKPTTLWRLLYCCFGITVSFTLHGVVLEKITMHRVLGELSMTFVFCGFNSLVALGLRRLRNEKRSTMPQRFVVVVGALAFGSTIASMVALRYVAYVTRILGKSCKSIPVMFVGVLLGKKYAAQKYVSVLVLSIGVAVFLLGTDHETHSHVIEHDESHDRSRLEQERTPNMVLGVSLLVLSLIFDGATGALEDKFMEKYDIGAFDLMYYVSMYKALFSAAGMVINGEVPVFVQHIVPSLPSLVLLSLTGAFGQAFIFYTISTFGALTTAIIGTCRKVLSIVLSVFLFAHVLTLGQMVGLGLSFLGIGLNWATRKNLCAKPLVTRTTAMESPELDVLSKESLLESYSDDTADSELDEQEMTLLDRVEDDEEMSAEIARKLELVNAWHRQTSCETERISMDDDASDSKDAVAV